MSAIPRVLQTRAACRLEQPYCHSRADGKRGSAHPPPRTRLVGNPLPFMIESTRRRAPRRSSGSARRSTRPATSLRSLLPALYWITPRAAARCGIGDARRGRSATRNDSSGPRFHSSKTAPAPASRAEPRCSKSWSRPDLNVPYHAVGHHLDEMPAASVPSWVTPGPLVLPAMASSSRGSANRRSRAPE